MELWSCTIGHPDLKAGVGLETACSLTCKIGSDSKSILINSTATSDSQFRGYVSACCDTIY